MCYQGVIWNEKVEFAHLYSIQALLLLGLYPRGLLERLRPLLDHGFVLCSISI